jgi:two-component system sensor kinase FixL
VTTQNIQQSYATALESHLSGMGEEGLHHAYQFGRKAMVEGLSLLDITMLHHEVLSIMAARWRPEEQAARILRAAEFLAEALSPFEMALRGWHDTATRLRHANDELEERVAQRTAAHLQAVERLDRAQEIAGSGSWEWNLQTGEQIWSKQLYRICGLASGPHPPGAPDIFSLIEEADRDQHTEWLARLLAGGDVGPIEYRLKRRDGRIRTVRAEGEPVATEGSAGRFSFTLQDITEQKAAEAELHDLQAELTHASRLSAMGQMAAAIVHELNQPLAAMSNYMAAARRLLDRDDEHSKATLRGALERAGEQAVRGSHIIERVRGFSAQGDNALRPEKISPLLREALELLLVGTRTDGVRIRLPSEMPDVAVLVDKIQVQQVLLNLLRNAVEAVAAGPRKEITLALAVRGDFVQISVVDSGSGLAEEVRAKLFQPFVSTKKTGMGIGLSICHKIVTAHSGQLWAEPNPSGGTIFHLTLPVASQSEFSGGEVQALG